MPTTSLQPDRSQELLIAFQWDECLRRMDEEGAGLDADTLLKLSELEKKIGRSFLEDVAGKMRGYPFKLFLSCPPCSSCGERFWFSKENGLEVCSKCGGSSGFTQKLPENRSQSDAATL